MNLHSGDDAYVLRCEIRHQHTSHRPVHYIDAAYVARADRQIRSLVVTCGIQSWQVVRVMAEVGIHFEDVIVFLFDGPSESGDVSRAESQFSFSLYHEEAFWELLLHPSYYVGSAVGRVVFYHKNVEDFLQSEHRADDVLDIFFFIVSRNNYNAVTCLHNSLIIRDYTCLF